MENIKLFLQSLAGMLFLFTVMSACLFLPKMTFQFPLAWIYLVVFFIPVIIITIYIFVNDKNLLKSRLAVGAVAEKRCFQKIIQGLAGVFFISIYIVSAFDYKLGWSVVPLWLSYLANTISFISFVGLFFVFKQNSFLSVTIEIQSQQKVISTGLYEIVRHPMYMFASVLLLFTPLALGSFFGLIFSISTIILIYFRAIDEEKELITSLEGYNDYCKKVKYRLIPFIL